MKTKEQITVRTFPDGSQAYDLKKTFVLRNEAEYYLKIKGFDKRETTTCTYENDYLLAAIYLENDAWKIVAYNKKGKSTAVSLQ